MPAKFWETAREFEKVRRETEQKTGQILTSDVIDKVLSSTANAFFETGKKGDLDSEIDQLTQAESTLKGESLRNCFKRKSRRPKTAVKRNTNKLATGTHFGEEAWETRRNEMKTNQPFAELQMPQSMERNNLIAAETTAQLGMPVEGLAPHPFAKTQSELDANSDCSMPWDLNKRFAKHPIKKQTVTPHNIHELLNGIY